ncbi:MAG TPA: TetR/AcrR family transcriptional regulator [Solirubrobacterales bacterium]|nr:TetR/AcrR family transcriptional regulator [Solirubrobacterales bacterium]
MEHTGGKRRDAAANRQAVVDTAIELLAEDPDAGMAEIAERTGLGRTTVYRHFPNRKALFEGLAEEVIRQGNSEIEAAVAQDPAVSAVLRAAAAMNVELGMRYPFLFAHQAVTKPALQRVSRRGGDALTDFLAGARERGEVRTDQPLRWLMAAQLAISLAMIGDLLAGRIGREQAAPFLGETLIAMMAPR